MMKYLMTCLIVLIVSGCGSLSPRDSVILTTSSEKIENPKNQEVVKKQQQEEDSWESVKIVQPLTISKGILGYIIKVEEENGTEYLIRAEKQGDYIYGVFTGQLFAVKYSPNINSAPIVINEGEYDISTGMTNDDLILMCIRGSTRSHAKGIFFRKGLSFYRYVRFVTDQQLQHGFLFKFEGKRYVMKLKSGVSPQKYIKGEDVELTER